MFETNKYSQFYNDGEKAADCHQNDDVLDYGHAGIREVGPRMELIL